MELITQDYFIIEAVETQRPRESCKRNYVQLAGIYTNDVYRHFCTLDVPLKSKPRLAVGFIR